MPVPEWVEAIVRSEKEKRGIHLEPKLLNGNYSLYLATSKYGSSRKGARKVS